MRRRVHLSLDCACHTPHTMHICAHTPLRFDITTHRRTGELLLGCCCCWFAAAVLLLLLYCTVRRCCYCSIVSAPFVFRGVLCCLKFTIFLDQNYLWILSSIFNLLLSLTECIAVTVGRCRCGWVILTRSHLNLHKREVHYCSPAVASF